LTTHDPDVAAIKVSVARMEIEMTAIGGKVDLIDRCIRGDFDDHKTPSLMHRVGILEEATAAKTANVVSSRTLAASIIVSLIAAGASIAASLTH
jgi:hypothetical protein